MCRQIIKLSKSTEERTIQSSLNLLLNSICVLNFRDCKNQIQTIKYQSSSAEPLRPMLVSQGQWTRKSFKLRSGASARENFASLGGLEASALRELDEYQNRTTGQ